MRTKFKTKISDAEYDQKFSQLLDKSFSQFEEGKFKEMTPEKLEEIFSKHKK